MIVCLPLVFGIIIFHNNIIYDIITIKKKMKRQKITLANFCFRSNITNIILTNAHIYNGRKRYVEVINSRHRISLFSQTNATQSHLVLVACTMHNVLVIHHPEVGRQLRGKITPDWPVLKPIISCKSIISC